MTRLKVTRTEDVSCGLVTCERCRFLVMSAQARDSAGCSLFLERWKLSAVAIERGKTETLTGSDVIRLQQCLDAEGAAQP